MEENMFEIWNMVGNVITEPLFLLMRARVCSFWLKILNMKKHENDFIAHVNLLIATIFTMKH
jgi:hypothetical protein